MKSPATHRRYFRFGLRTFLAVVAMAGVSLGWFMHRVNQQKAAVQWVQENMGAVEYAIATKPPRLAWLRTLVGVDGVAKVRSVSLDADPLFVSDNSSKANRRSVVSELSPLVNLKSLEELHLSGMPVSDVSPLVNLKSLKTLDLSGTLVSDVSPLANLKSLETLDLSGTLVSDATPLANLKSLKTLDLSGTQVSDVSPLANLKSLETLDLSGTLVPDVSLMANLKSLKILDLCGTQVSDVSPLANLKSLKTLLLLNEQMEELSRSVETLRKALPNLKPFGICKLF
ncbi:MAG: leucine-rich repeat domain-containing protein [Planctomycetales bacterium]|nr:leucine-rich repeat domain-containing protein [Planctomycetales bacterium]